MTDGREIVRVLAARNASKKDVRIGEDVQFVGKALCQSQMRVVLRCSTVCRH